MTRTTPLKTLLIAAALAALSATTALAEHRGAPDGVSVNGRDFRKDNDRRDNNRDGQRWDNDHRDGRDDHRWGQNRGRDHDHGPKFDFRITDPAPVVCAPAPAKVWCEPVYRTVCDTVLVPATYRTVVDRVWVPDVTQTVCEKVWVGPVYELRDVVRYDARGCRIVTRERVLVAPGHYEDRPRTVIVTPGHYEDRPRQELVCAARYEKVERQELVTPGHWAYATPAPAPVLVANPGPRLDLRVRF